MAQQEEGRASTILAEFEDDGFIRAVRVFAGIMFSISAFFVGIQMAACVAVLVLSKHEKPHVPLRAFIIGQLCGCSLYLLLRFLDYLIQDRLLADDSSSDSAIDGDCLIRFQFASSYIQWATGCFLSAWYVVGSLWVSQATATSSEAPMLFWTSLGFLILAAGGIAISLLAMLCCIPCILCYAACFKVFPFLGPLFLFARPWKLLQSATQFYLHCDTVFPTKSKALNLLENS